MNNMYYYHRLIENAVNTGSARKSGTFRGWQEKAIKARQALKQVRQDYEQDLQELHGKYTTKYFLEEKAKLEANYNGIVQSAVTKLTEDLEDVIESKRRQFDKVSGAPSAEDLRLLEALNMRTSLSIAEVANTIGKLNGNVQSLAVLRDIAAKHDIRIPAGATTPEEFDTMMQRAKEYSLDRLRDIDTPDRDMNYKGKCFFDYPDHPGEASHFYDPLDNNVLTTEQITTATRQAQQPEAKAPATETAPAAAKTGEGDAVPMWAEVTCSGNMSLSTIAEQFHVTPQQIREANGGRDLDRLYTGDKILVPSTQFSFQPDPSGGHVQPDQVRPVPAVTYEYKTGPNGEAIGDDVSIM